MNAGLRLVAYLVACGLGIYLVVDALIDAKEEPDRLQWMLADDGALEWFQATLAALFALLCLNAAMRFSTALHTLLTILALGAMVSELEGLLQSVLASDMPRRVVQLFGLAAAGYLAARFRRVVGELRDGLQRPGLLLMVAGLVVHAALAQMLGKEDLWEIFTTDATRVELARAAVEETVELAGYLLLLCGAFEERFGSRPPPPAADAPAPA